MLSLVAMLSTEGAAFVAPHAKRELADEARRRFTCSQVLSLLATTTTTAYLACNLLAATACVFRTPASDRLQTPA